jgi:hypothetical protein
LEIHSICILFWTYIPSNSVCVFLAYYCELLVIRLYV